MKGKQKLLTISKITLPILITVSAVLIVMLLNTKQTKFEIAEQLEQPKYPERVYHIATKQELLDEINKRRAEVGSPPLRHSQILEESAQQKCDDMVTRKYYAHADPDGKQGYQIAIDMNKIYGNYGENLIKRSLADHSAHYVFNDWFESQPHKDAALDARYTDTGFGICGSNANLMSSMYFVEHFYSPTAF